MNNMISDEGYNRSFCGTCERRKSNPTPVGTGKNLARDLGGTVTKCLDVCNKYSEEAGEEGVNYVYEKEGSPRQVGTIVVDEQGNPLPYLRTYEPQDICVDYSGIPLGVEVEIRITEE